MSGDARRNRWQAIVGARPSEATGQRIVEGALRRARDRQRVPVLPLVIAGASALALLALLLRPEAIPTPWPVTDPTSPTVDRSVTRALLWAPTPAPAVAPRTAEHARSAQRPRPRGGDPIRRPAHPHAVSWQTTDRSAAHALGRHRVTLDARTRVQGNQDRLFTALRVERGRAFFAVEPLRAGETFAVHTHLVRVEVVGTRFAVETDALCSRVAVEHGAVQVTPRGTPMIVLRAGQGRTFCRAPAGQEVIGTAERLLQRALELIDGGDDRAALPLLQRCLARFGGEPLAEDALFHLVLTHHRLGQIAPRDRQARTFLQRFSATARATRLRRLQKKWTAQQPR